VTNGMGSADGRIATLRRLLLGGAVGVLASLCLSAQADAATKTFTGSAKNDSDSKMTIKFKVDQQGSPTALKSVKFSHVDVFQTPSPGVLGEPCAVAERSGKLGDLGLRRGPAPSEFTISGDDESGGEQQFMNGALSPYPKVKQGFASLSFIAAADSSVCSSADFKLKKS
jgi:hypothetical protein